MIQKIHNALLHYLETNRRDNLNIKTGWHLRLQDIYVAHYRQSDARAAGAPAYPAQHHDEKK